MDDTYTWSRSGDAPLTALEQDVHVAYADAQRTCFEATGSFMAREHIVRFVGGFVYRRGPTVDERKVRERVSLQRARAAALVEQGSSYYESELRPAVVALVAPLRRPPRANAPYAVLAGHLTAAVDAHARVMGDLHWRIVVVAPFDWQTEVRASAGDDVDTTVLAGGLDNASTRLVRRLCALARIARSDPALSGAVASGSPAAVDELGDSPAARRFRAGFRRLLRDYGLRSGHGWGSVTTFLSPTWNMRPDRPLAMVATYARSDPDAIERAWRASRSVRMALVRRIRRRLSGDAERVARFERAYALGVEHERMMEDHNHVMDNDSAGVLREALDVVGRRLVSDGVLDDVEDVRHLTLDELRAPPSDARSLVARRRSEHDEQRSTDPPPSLGRPAAGDRPSMTIGAMEARGRGLVGSTLHGVAASRGRYTGRARVVSASEAAPDVVHGDVLVADDAGPAWTPVFPLLGALVLDRGATFQHAAVMAREFGIPAVLGTVSATKAIADGQTVTVDGSAGVVELES